MRWGPAFGQVYNFHDFGRCLAAGRRGSTAVALLVQSGEGATLRRSTGCGVSPGMPPDSPWDGGDYRTAAGVPGNPAGASGRGVGAGRQRLSQAGEEVGGSGPAVLREAGEGGQLPGGDVPGLCQPVGTGIGGQGAVSAADDAFGMSPSFREGLAALGMWYVLDVPSGFTVWPPEPAWTSAEYQGFGRPRKPRLRDGQRRTMEQRSDELPEEAWREITVAEGSQGPRSYLFSAQRVRPTSRRKPGEIHWAVYRRNRDGSEPRYYLSNAPEDTPLETLAYVGGSRWRIETEFETEKSDVGLDEYETRTWAGWHHHVALCLLGGAFLLSLQQAWGGKDAPDHEAAGLPGGAGNAAPGTVRANRVAAVA